MADYIHRCGRIGRIGSPENSHITNFVSGYHEIEMVQKIEVSYLLILKQYQLLLYQNIRNNEPCLVLDTTLSQFFFI